MWKLIFLYSMLVSGSPLSPFTTVKLYTCLYIKAATLHCKNSPNEETFRDFQDAGITHVVFIPKGTMYKYPESDDIGNTYGSPFWSENAARFPKNFKQVRKYGMDVIVKYHLYLNEKLIAKGELERIKYSDNLWKHYRKQILDLAKMCEREKVPIFVIGNETTELYKSSDKWIELIRDVRKVYKGKLTIGAAASKVEEVTFWEHLDFIGISAYYKVANRKNPTEIEMRVGWEYHAYSLRKLSIGTSKPVLFTEFGSNASEELAMKPYLWSRNLSKDNLNYNLQAGYYKTMFNTFWDEDWFAGIFIWETYALNEITKNNESGTIQGKPAWDEIKKWR